MRSHGQYREIGEKLAEVLQDNRSDKLESYNMTGLIADLANADNTMIIPLKDLTKRTGFIEILHLAGSGKGRVKAHALLVEVASIYNTETVECLGEFIHGFLGLDVKSISQEDLSSDIKKSNDWHTEQSGRFASMPEVELEQHVADTIDTKRRRSNSDAHSRLIWKTATITLITLLTSVAASQLHRMSPVKTIIPACIDDGHGSCLYSEWYRKNLQERMNQVCKPTEDGSCLYEAK